MPVPGSWMLLGAPFDGSGEGRGEIRAPGHLRAAGLAAALGAGDLGDLPIAARSTGRDPVTGIVAYGDVLDASAALLDAAGSLLATGRRPLVVGGCCSVLPGAFAASTTARGPTGLVYLDGHLDLHTGVTSRTGNPAGMALAVLLGAGPHDLTSMTGTAPLLEPGLLAAIGHAPDPSDAATEDVAGLAPGAVLVPAADLLLRDARALGQEVAARFERMGRPFWLHLDVDVVDGRLMPAVSFPVSNGVTWPALGAVLEGLGGSEALVGVTLADFNADRDPDGRNARRLVGLLGATLTGAGPGTRDTPAPRAGSGGPTPRSRAGRLADLEWRP